MGGSRRTWMALVRATLARENDSHDASAAHGGGRTSSARRAPAGCCPLRRCRRHAGGAIFMTGAFRCCFALMALLLSLAHAAAQEHKRVLILHSVGREFR